MRISIPRIALALVLIAVATASWSEAQSPPVDLATATVIDLSHPYNASTLYWPSALEGSAPRFSLDVLSAGKTPGGWYYAANRFCTPEHGGTHLDAPRHFAEGRRTVDQLPLRQLVAPGVVIDVRGPAGKDRDFRLTIADVTAWEAAHGRIPKGAIVLLRTGWESRWGDRKAYFGDDKPGDASNLHFPSFGAEAARFLIAERGVGALGVDTPSIDHGPSADFLVHRLAAEREVPGLENLRNLSELPASGFWVVALPMNIAGGSGAPVRVIALVAPAS